MRNELPAGRVGAAFLGGERVAPASLRLSAASPVRFPLILLATASASLRRLASRYRWSLRVTLTSIFLLVAVIFVGGRFDVGFATAVLSPWVVQCAGLFVGLAVAALSLGFPRLVIASLIAAIWGTAVAMPVIHPKRIADRSERVVAAAQLGTAPRIRVLQANVCHRNEPTADAVAWIQAEGADLVGIVEFNEAWQRALEPLQASLRHSVLCPHTDQLTGVALYSRYPLSGVRIESAFPGAPRHIEATVHHPAGAIRVFVAHPPSPRTAARVAVRNRFLAELTQRCADPTIPTILLGDLNETPFGRPLQDFVRVTGYRSAREAAGYTPSWPAEVAGVPVPEAFRIPIDHVFASADFRPETCRVGRSLGSDHLPLAVELRWESAASRFITAPACDGYPG